MELHNNPSDQRLRNHIRNLGELLGEAFSRDHGPSFLQTVEDIRLLAKNSRSLASSDGAANVAPILERLKTLPDDELLAVCRAFSQFLSLANIAEQIASLPSPGEPSADHLATVFDKLEAAASTDIAAASSAASADLTEQLQAIRCELVLTAHPTEISRRTLIHKLDSIAAILQHSNSDGDIATAPRQQLSRLITEIWYTDEIRQTRPTPQDEAKWGFAVIENSLWQAIPLVQRRFDQLLEQATGNTRVPGHCNIRIASWMGGDRDGNPNVTAAVTREVLSLARWMAADLYIRDMDELLSQLSMGKASNALIAQVGTEAREPYRALIRPLRARLAATRDWAEGNDRADGPAIMLEREALEQPLRLCYQSLCESGMAIIADGLLRDVLIRLDCFGLTLGQLDIRQSSDKHQALLAEITSNLGLGDYSQWPEQRRCEFLVAELNNPRPLVAHSWQCSAELAEVLACVRLVGEVQADGIGCYIISMARYASDILAVKVLLKKSGLLLSLPVVPLFETLADLDRSLETLETLFQVPGYLESVDHQQQIMIGYSDSAKDAGQLAASWAQYRSQEKIVELCQRYEVDFTLFHGRGGTVGRGGGPARDAILSQPPGSVNSHMRVTEQGEMIRFKYGSVDLAVQNIDLMLSATIEASLLPLAKPKPQWCDFLDRLSAQSCASYSALVKENSDFVRYFYQGTPLEELALLALGSRPARRGSSDPNAVPSVDDLRAIPWVFAWMQKRLMVPAWLGTDRAFEQSIDDGELALLQDMFHHWPYFTAQINLLEMVLAKADSDLSAYYDRVLVNAELQPIGVELRTRLGLMITSVNRIKNQDTLLQSEAEIAHSLALRDPYSDPLHLLQVELLKRYRDAGDNQPPALAKALLVTITGIAAAMRNTG